MNMNAVHVLQLEPLEAGLRSVQLMLTPGCFYDFNSNIKKYSPIMC